MYYEIKSDSMKRNRFIKVSVYFDFAYFFDQHFLRCCLFQELFAYCIGNVTIPTLKKIWIGLTQTFASIRINRCSRSATQLVPSFPIGKYTNLSFILTNYYNICSSHIFVLLIVDICTTFVLALCLNPIAFHQSKPRAVNCV